jgi:hypothetical protein
VKPKLGRTIRQLHDVLTDLADEYRHVGERQEAEHDIHHMTRVLAQQCDAQAKALTPYSERYGADLPDESGDGLWHGLLAGVRHTSATPMGRLPATGMLLLSDLRQLHLACEEVAMLWLIVGQAAQATRDHELLETVERSREEVVSQLMWLTTRIKETAPQALVAG